MILAGVLIVLGLILTWSTWEITEDYEEYPAGWWIGWGVMTAGGLLAIAHFTQLRGPYLTWSSWIALFFALSFLFGKTDDEYSPAGWCALGVWISNAVVYLGGLFLSTTILAFLLALVGAVLWFVGRYLHSADEYYYDFAMLTGIVMLATAGMLYTHAIRTPLEHLNEVLVPELNTLIQEAESKVSTYDSAFAQATSCQTLIVQEFSDETNAYAVLAEENIQNSKADLNSANDELVSAGGNEGVFAEYEPAKADEIHERTLRARAAIASAQSALDFLNQVCRDSQELAEEWRRTITWVEIAAFWPNESSYTNFPACYYGELYTVVHHDDTYEEILIDDENIRTGEECSAFGCPDRRDTNWKVFLIEDYTQMVNDGLIPPMDKSNPSDQELAEYLCGADPANGVYGVIEPGFTIVKEYGVLRAESEDGENLFVGNYRYGAWCYTDASGNLQSVGEEETPPTDTELEWCWHQQPGGSTHYYWRYHNGRYFAGPRRCVYCTPQDNWSGGALVRDSEMSTVNGTDQSIYRTPADVGGGPGAGK